ncbi:hypothetical protein [Edwardsiella tarda]|uniref:hypothetical protein n=1 Tax=Edwardsiella tarda TaxID=636 RepID=UPI00351C4176
MMMALNLSHSDQIVATLAKLPWSTFGTSYTKEVALLPTRHMNNAKGWSACLYLRSIAKVVGCTTHTVRNALRRLEALGFIKTEHQKHDQIDNWNLASVYRLGSTLRSLFNQSFHTPSTRLNLRLLLDRNKVTRITPALRSLWISSPCSIARTPEEWEASKQARMEHNRSVLQKLKTMLGGDDEWTDKTDLRGTRTGDR